eukprot:11876607-Ditylum_brightwellii.AAC.1
MNHQTSIQSTCHLVRAILHEHELNLQDYDWTMNKGQWQGGKHKSKRYDNIFNEVCLPLLPDLQWGLEERAKEGGD